jgi:hypothetical protein
MIYLTKFLLYTIGFSFFMESKSFSQQIFVKSTVNFLNIRDSCSIYSRKIGNLNKGDSIGYILEKVPTTEAIFWNGKPTRGYWYKVKLNSENKESIGWVFNKGVEFVGIKFDKATYGADPEEISNEFIELKYVEANYFNKLDYVKINWVPEYHVTMQPGNDFTLYYKNGTKKLFSHLTDDGYVLKGELKNLSYYYVFKLNCCGSSIFINSNTGKELEVQHPLIAAEEFTNIKYPVFAPDQKTFAYLADCEPGGEYEFGFASVKNEKFSKIAFFDHLFVRNFRFIDNNSGIARLQSGKFLRIRIMK